MKISVHCTLKGGKRRWWLENHVWGTRMLGSLELIENLVKVVKTGKRIDSALIDLCLDRKIVLEKSAIDDEADPYLKRLALALGFPPSIRDIPRLRKDCLSRATETLKMALRLPPQPHRRRLLAEPPRMLTVLRHHLDVYLTHEHARPQSLDPRVLIATLGRPRPDLFLEQQPCLLWSAQERARKLLQHAKPGWRILFLGEDDLISLATLALCTLEQFPRIDVIDMDEGLVRFLNQRLPPPHRVIRRDLSIGLTQEFYGRYDVVVADPPNQAGGMRAFLECAAKALKPDGVLQLSTSPLLLEEPDTQRSDLVRLGLHEEEELADFILYPSFRTLPDAADEFIKRYGLPAEPWSTFFQVPLLYAHFFTYRKTRL